MSLEYAFEREAYAAKEDMECRGLIRFAVPPDSSLSTAKWPTHLCFVLDVSGSMDVPDKYPYLLQAVELLAQNLEEHQWLSLILFSTDALLVASFLDAETARKGTGELLQRIESFPGKFQTTHLAPGLELALKQLERGEEHRGLVQRLYVLTDGQLHDARECLRFGSYLQQLRVEFMSYGFGSDFALQTMREIMAGCYGGGVKSLTNTGLVRETFRHLSEVGSRVVARETNLRLSFSPGVIGGDGFLHRPMTRYFPRPPEGDLHFPLGMLEIGRSYVLAFEARLPGEGGEEQEVGEALFSYQAAQGETYHDRLLLEVTLAEKAGEIRPEIAEVWADLEGHRRQDPETHKAALRARINIARREHRSPEDIAALEDSLRQLEEQGNLDDLPEETRQIIDSDLSTCEFLPLDELRQMMPSGNTTGAASGATTGAASEAMSGTTFSPPPEAPGSSPLVPEGTPEEEKVGEESFRQGKDVRKPK